MFRKLRDYFVSSAAELRKVMWPTRRMVVNHTLVIIVSTLFIIAVVGLVDYGLTVLLKDIIVTQ